MGFELIAFNEGWDNITYVDSLAGFDDVLGNSYCYLVTSIFEDEFNSSIDARLESCASNEVCVQVELDTLFTVRDSVAETDLANGSIQLRWTQPDNIDDFFPNPIPIVFFGVLDWDLQLRKLSNSHLAIRAL